MKPTRRISVSLPAALIDEALQISGKSLPATLEEGLTLLKRKSLFDKAMRLKGKIHLDVDLDESRERRRR